MTGQSSHPSAVALRARLEQSAPTPQGVAGVVAAVGASLGADRCWLYARDPARRRGIAAARWLRHATVTDLPAGLRSWTAESGELPARDPLFARALAGAPLDAVTDTRVAGVDRELEDALGHRAFVHLNLHAGGELWGTLQPAMTGAPRVWTRAELDALLELRPRLGELVAALVRARGDGLGSIRLVGDAPEGGSPLRADAKP